MIETVPKSDTLSKGSFDTLTVVNIATCEQAVSVATTTGMNGYLGVEHLTIFSQQVGFGLQ